MLSPKTTQIIVSLVATIWAGNFVAGLVLPHYQSDQAINGIFMAIVGGALALGRKGDPPSKGGGRK